MLCFQVEVWLNRLLDSMRDTVRHEMTESVTAYEEKPRDQWLFDYPAQVHHLLHIPLTLNTAIEFNVVRKEESSLETKFCFHVSSNFVLRQNY